MVDEMMTAATSASALARRLLRLGRTEPLEFEAIALASLVQRTVAMIRRQVPGIEFHVDISDEVALRGSQEELHQVLVNLFINARDAMPTGGSVRVFAREVTFDRAQAATHHLPAKGDYVELVVADTGTGMDEATLARVFDPFFTTKPGGTGLGLPIVHRAVDAHRGIVLVDSTPRGTRFTMLLPRSRFAEAEAA